MYSLVYSDRARKQIGKLPHEIQKRIISSLERIRIRPEVYIDKLVGISGYKFRVGNYRVILDLEEEKLLILVLEVGHRKNVYDS